MAKLARNRVMYFGCWDPAAIVASAKANVGDSTGIDAATVTVATFASKVNGSGEYTFLCVASYVAPVDEGDPTPSKWELNGEEVSLSAYGISITDADAVKGDIIVVTYTAAASGGWEAIGKDNDDLSKELNPDTEKSKNVLGEATFTHKGYEPEISVDPYFIDPSRKMYKRISENARKEKFAENDLVGYFAEAYFDTANPATGKMTGTCIVRKAWYVPQSTGGDTSGYAVPVTITPFGPSEEKVITYDMATNEATISDPS